MIRSATLRAGFLGLSFCLALAGFAEIGHTGEPDVGIDLEGLEFRLEQLKREEHSLKNVLDRGLSDEERVRARVVARGRAYYRLTRGIQSEDFFEHTMRVERVRQGLLQDLKQLDHLTRQRGEAGRRLDVLREKRAPLEIEKTAVGRARDALLSRSERERAFSMAFSASGRADHTAVYSPASQLDFLGDTFASMRGKLPFPLPGRAEIELVRLAYADGPGLVLRGAAGTPARSVYSGRVVYADEYAEYGKTVILDHGENYFTVTAGLQKIDVKVGEDLPQSARLGLAGTSGGSAKIYFEIRQRNETLPPGDWLGI